MNPPDPQAAQGARSDNFDLLRALGALLVLVSHCFALTGRPEPVVPGVATYGGLGVAVFFCISGYLIAGSWQRDPRLAAFLTKRVLRILPGLAVVVLLCMFVLGPIVTAVPLADYLASPATWRYLDNLRLHITYALPGVFETVPGPHAVNGSLWTLPVEFCMYLVVALIGVALRGRPWAYAAAFLAMAGGALAWLPRHAEPVVFYAMDVRYLFIFGPFYFAGACVQAFAFERRLTRPLLAALGIALAATFWSPTAYQIVQWFGLTAFVIALGLERSRIGARVSRFGDTSYGLYIYAFPVQQLLVSAFPAPPLLPYILAVFVLTLALAALSWHLVEKPCLGLKPRATGRRRTGSDAEALAEKAS